MINSSTLENFNFIDYSKIIDLSILNLLDYSDFIENACYYQENDDRLIVNLNPKNKKMLEWVDIDPLQPDWRTTEEIYNYYNYSQSSPACCCCWRYHTLGTNQGDWYLPACGELAIIAVQQSEINEILTSINTIYPNDCFASLYTERYPVINILESGSSYSFYINFSNGNIGIDMIYRNYYAVLAMLSL